MQLNPFNQTIGDALADFTPGAIPQVEVLEDQTVLVEKLTEKHLDDLYEVYEPTSPLQNWTYLPIEPFTDKDSFTSYFLVQTWKRRQRITPIPLPVCRQVQ